MKHNLTVLLISLLVTSLAFSGETTDKIKLGKLTVQITLPSKDFKGTQEKRDDTIMKFYTFPTVLDSRGRSVTPTIGIIIEKVGPANPILYFTMKRAAFKFQDMEMFAPNSVDFLKLPSAVGCFAKSPYQDGQMHKIIYITANHDDYGIQILVDATLDTFAQIEEQAKQIIKSITIK